MIFETIQPIIHKYYTINPAPKQQDFFTTYLPLISPVIVVVTFLINTIITWLTKKAEVKRAWYFKAHFENQVKKIEAFFDSSDKIMSEALHDYQLQHVGWSPEEKSEFIGKVLFELADNKRKFQIEVLNVLQHTYPTVFENTEDYLLNFEDAGSEAFSGSYDKEAYFRYLTSVNEIKANLLKVLSKPAL